jgi:hypothetical protein
VNLTVFSFLLLFITLGLNFHEIKANSTHVGNNLTVNIAHELKPTGPKKIVKNKLNNNISRAIKVAEPIFWVLLTAVFGLLLIFTGVYLSFFVSIFLQILGISLFIIGLVIILAVIYSALWGFT